MHTYWNLISSKHQNKLKFLARKSGVTADRALRNIVNYLQSENHASSRPEYFRDFITDRDVERMIDTITR